MQFELLQLFFTQHVLTRHRLARDLPTAQQRPVPDATTPRRVRACHDEACQDRDDASEMTAAITPRDAAKAANGICEMFLYTD